MPCADEAAQDGGRVQQQQGLEEARVLFRLGGPMAAPPVRPLGEELRWVRVEVVGGVPKQR